MKDHLILAIDVGTQSVRAILFDLRGNPVAICKDPLPPWQSPCPGWAEQDAGTYWEKICSATAGLWHNHPGLKGSVRGVALTTQRSTVVNVDRAGRPIRPAILWADQRTAQSVPKLSLHWSLAFRLLRLGETVAYLQSQAESNWLKLNQPLVWEGTYKFLFLSGYLVHRLTGNFADSAASQVGYMPFDFRRQDWARPSDWKWQALDMDPGKLPDLVRPGQMLGQISREAAAATGIPEDLPLVAAAADKACEVLGAGCLDPHQGSISYGTSASINMTSSRYVEPLPLIPPYPSALPGAYSLEVQIFRGFWLASWFIREFCPDQRLAARESGADPEELLDQAIAGIPPGSQGLVLQPFWSPGLRDPGPEARGAMIGFRDGHTRAHLYRALLEGLAYSLREGGERIEKRSRHKITELRVSGGGSRSARMLQITADVFNRPALRPHTWETSALGAAMVAAVGLGLFTDFKSAADSMVRIRDITEPNPESVKIYEDLYQSAYKPLYKRLKPLYKAIRL